MSTDVKKSWLASRLPCPAKETGNCAPTLERGAPYLARLPALITGAALLLLASGFVLAVYYNPDHGFASIQFIARNVNSGWLIQGFHATGATMLFAAVYLLLFRDIYRRAYTAPGELVWLLRVKLFALLLLVGWLGYALSDGAVAYWSLTDAANAATGLGGAAGVVGRWFFGGPNGAGTLARLEVFHAVLALAVLGTLGAHRCATRALARQAKPKHPVSCHPYYTAQTFAAFAVFALIFAVLMFFAPHYGLNPLNRAAADSLIIPAVLSPPWYLAPVSAVASVFSTTLGSIFGVIAMLAVLAALPWLDRSSPAGKRGLVYRLLMGLLLLDVIGLGWSVSDPACTISGSLTVFFTIWYFFHFLVLTPLVTALEAK
ncbi:cytochrome b N-terminal domain-containing protein [Acidocella sp.]|uniref:cytochrome b N-terminal domain-containing protein n=1 Tax=Acidocella sp. TaxID=50710 RepID=UPI0017965B87|nr:cytochrome b N-terminal domain-containing protein [Acidocella sp.]NNM58028.1 cytochrome bc complex cytochrome b subunit [Acidocella sp.]